jgi:AcrR family transcriptional regulator
MEQNLIMTSSQDLPPPGGARDRLVGAADQLFYRRGLHVGINEIVGTAGVAKTSLYLHFSSKDELVAAYLAGRTDTYLTQWRQRLDGCAGRPPHERIDAIFDALRLFVASEGYRGCPYVNAAAELPDRDHPGYGPIMDYRNFVRDELFAQIVTEAGVADPVSLCAQLQLIYDGALAGAVVENTPEPVDRARAIAHTILQAAEPAVVQAEQGAGPAV